MNTNMSTVIMFHPRFVQLMEFAQEANRPVAFVQLDDEGNLIDIIDADDVEEK